ncbi:multidrug and toxin extrusion protein 1-like [Syngnathus typhle]|uniref:multidrug and toxin extrusion protein 1-like n=1 Tax=Syngnathus typhle TaxID=161592 RepID=UPI002A6A768F|nr:multidrug and toxin extrusion protein 1-like [Syngnathus typhle]
MLYASMEEATSDKIFCCRWMRRKLPKALREEVYHLLRMMGPLLVARILSYLLPFVVTMFCGHLTNEVMAGYGLASATINITTAATGLGLGFALDTLVAQTFGSRNLLRVGVILQRGIIIMLLFCLPCWGLLLNAQSLLLLMGQDPEVTRIAQLYITAYLPAIPAMFLYNLQFSYLQNQGIILPQVYAAVLANVANLLTNYIFISVLDFGVYGSAAASTLTEIYLCVFQFAYIWWKKLHKTTWGGWSVESLQEWGSFMKLAIPSTLMTCFEWWIYDLGGLFAGMLGKDELAAHHALITVGNLNYMVTLGIQAAACARVGNALGAGDTAGAILTCKVALTLSVAFAVVQATVVGATKSVIGFLFTSDPKIISLLSRLMSIYCVLQLFEAIVGVSGGIFMGSGKQKIPAVANFIGYYCIGLSIGVVLMFVSQLSIFGFWLGHLISVVLQAIFYIVVIFKLNWKSITEEALKRAQAKPDVPLLNTSAAACNQNEEQTQVQHTSMEGFTHVCDECPDVDSKSPPGNKEDAGHLSVSQLVLRRGITMVTALGLLAVGTCVHFLVPPPESSMLLHANLTFNNATNSPLQTVTMLDW